MRAASLSVHVEPSRQLAAPTGGPITQALVLVLLASSAVVSYARSIAPHPGIDFYDCWAVPTVRALRGPDAGDPYRSRALYGRVLNAYVGQVPGDAKLAMANVQRLDPDLTGSPLLYVIATLLPRPYSTALAAFRALQLVLFLGALVTLGHLVGEGVRSSVGLALVLLLVDDPVRNDLAVANLNLVLLAGMAFAIAASQRNGAMSNEGAGFARGGRLVALAGLALLKPLVLLPCALVAASVLSMREARRGALAVAVAGSLVLIATPCIYFRSASIWWAWYQAIHGVDPAHLVYPVEQGNYAFVLLTGQALGLRLSIVTLATAAALGGSCVLLARRGRPGPADGFGLAAAGVVVTLALSPLAWNHYYLLLLLPVLWLVGRRTAAPGVMAFAAVTAVMSTGVLDPAWELLGQPAMIPWSRALSWIPAWMGILLVVRGEPAPRAP